MIIILMLVLTPIVTSGILILFWNYCSPETKKRIIDKQNSFKKPPEKPFGELRAPMMFAATSAIFFILIVGMFGVSYDTRSGEMLFHMDPGDDWSGNFNPEAEGWREQDPMRQFPDWIYYVMVLGFFVTIAFISYGWFEYQKWKWGQYADYIDRE